MLFYGESGGQVGDIGFVIFENGVVFWVEDIQKCGGDLYVYIGVMEKGEIMFGDGVSLVVDVDKCMESKFNYLVIYLLYVVLCDVLGVYVIQKGFYVGLDCLCFDFLYNGVVIVDEIVWIEVQVNVVICQNVAVLICEMVLDVVIEVGVMVLFGEKYGDIVWVLLMGCGFVGDDKVYFVELCGGIYVEWIGDIVLFKIIGESVVLVGVCCIEGLIGEVVCLFMEEQMGFGCLVVEVLKIFVVDLLVCVVVMQDECKKFECQLVEVKKQFVMGGGGGIVFVGLEDINGIKFIGCVVEGVGGKDLCGLVDEVKIFMGLGIVVFIGVNDGKVVLVVGVFDDLIVIFSFVDFVCVGFVVVGGKGGGGWFDFVQVGGFDGSKVEDVLVVICVVIVG